MSLYVNVFNVHLVCVAIDIGCDWLLHMNLGQTLLSSQVELGHVRN
jgi:hypothetical protein